MANSHIIGQYFKWKIEFGPNSFLSCHVNHEDNKFPSCPPKLKGNKLMHREEAPTKGLPQATTNLSSLVENLQRKRGFE